jgi:CRISPR type III-B/RAMP module-associated protein Cmr5
MPTPTRDQERASIAYKCVQARKTTLNDAEKKEYRNMARAASATIRASGLAQALEFIATRSKSSQKAVLEDLGRVVLRQDQNPQAGETLKQQSRTEPDLMKYMLLTRESLACVQWLARFGESVLGG